MKDGFEEIVACCAGASGDTLEFLEVFGVGVARPASPHPLSPDRGEGERWSGERGLVGWAKIGMA